MITGVHAVVFSRAPDQVRAFFTDVLAGGTEIDPYQPTHPSPNRAR